jgi:hypothetical protein
MSEGPNARPGDATRSLAVSSSANVQSWTSSEESPNKRRRGMPDAILVLRSVRAKSRRREDEKKGGAFRR